MKSLTIFLLALSISLPAFAQRGLHLGLNGGYNAVFIMNQNNYGGTEYEYDAKFGYAAGVVVNYNFVEFLGLQLEVNTSSKGQSYKDFEGNLPVTRDVDLKYLDIPLMLKYTSPNGGTRFFAMGGFQYSILQDAAIEYYVGDDNRSPTDAIERFENSDMAFILGTGTNIMLPLNLYASVGLRFTYGLTDINDPEWRLPNQDDIYEPSRNATGGIRLGLHYAFPTGD